MVEKLTVAASRIFASLALRLVLIGLTCALAFNTYGDIAFKGPLGLGFHFEGWKPRAERFQHGLNDMLAAQVGAKAKEVARNRRVETATDTHAKEANTDEVENLTRQLDAADRYIASHRLQPQAVGCSSSGPAAAAAPGNPGLPPAMPADSLVAVSDVDLRKCTADATYAVGAYKWANPLNGIIQSAAAADDER